MIVPGPVPAATALPNCDFEIGGLAGEGRVDHGVERQRRGVGDDREHVVERDALLAVGVERELADLAARGLPVAADQRHERGAGVGRDGEPGLLHLVVDQPDQVALGVDIAADDGGEFRFLAERAHRRGAAKIAGLDDDPAIGRRRGENRFDRGREIAAAGLDPHRALAAEQRHGVRLLGEPRRLGGERVAFKPHQRERVVHVRDRGVDELFRALVHEARVGAEHQHDRLRRIGARDEGVGVLVFDRDHPTNLSDCARNVSRRRYPDHLRSIASTSAPAPARCVSKDAPRPSSRDAALRELRVARDRTLSAGAEIRREPRLDVLGNLLGGAVLGVALAAGVGEALRLAGVVVGHAGEGLPGDHRLAGGLLDQRIGGVDAVIAARRRGRW